MIEIQFEVIKIKYRNDETGYSILETKILKHPEDIDIPTAQKIIVGHFPVVHKKDEFIAEGNWIDAGKYGYQFKVNYSKLVFPETEKGMIYFLKECVKGVGGVVAKRIVTTFKEDTFQIILNEPDKLLTIPGVTEKKKESIYKAVFFHKEFEEVALYLLSVGLSHMEASKVYKELGYAAISKISSNPYILLSLKGFSFNKADTVAQNLHFKYDNPKRIYHGLLHFLQSRMDSRGDMFTYMTDIYNYFSEHLTRYGSYSDGLLISKESIDKAMAKFKRWDKVRIEDNDGDTCVYIKYFFNAENAIVKNIKNRLTTMNQWITHPSDLEEYLREEEGKGLMLAKNQKRAIDMALFNKLSILSGGPGTGKTHTINAIIKTIEHFKPGAEIKLAAPTGRAAKRMTEMTGKPAETIHRMVGIFGGEHSNPEADSFEELDADFLIIDESSMIDAHVFHVLLNAVSERTRILLVGDFNQLPSVGPGLILRDLMESNEIPKVVLDEIFRQAQDSQIVTNSYNLIHGKGFDSLNFDKRKKDFYFMEEENTEAIIDKILMVIKRALKAGNSLDDVQVLTVLNGGDLGVQELNKRIQRVFNPKNGRKREVKIRADFFLREGDRVMQTVNNYDLNVFNGEVGKVDKIEVVEKNGENIFELTVDYGDREVTYGDENLEEIVLAYAMSVHKSQGSEFKFVIMPIHGSLRVLLNQNIIYTGWTRAKQMVVMVGSKDELRDGMMRKENTIRNSLIRKKLQEEVDMPNKKRA